MASKCLANTLLSIFAGEEVVTAWRGVSGSESDGMRLQLPAVVGNLYLVIDFLELQLSGGPGKLGRRRRHSFSFFGGSPKDSFATLFL